MGEDSLGNLEESEALEPDRDQGVREMPPALGSDNEYPKNMVGIIKEVVSDVSRLFHPSARAQQKSASYCC
jgi:hypothetical protein